MSDRNPAPPELRQDRRAMLFAALVAFGVALVVALCGHVMMQAGLQRSTASLADATRIGASAVGQSIAAQFTRAADLGIPVEKLGNVEAYLQRIVDGSQHVRGLALLDEQGRTIAATAGAGSGERFAIGTGAVRATLVVAEAPPPLDATVLRLRIVLAATALLTGAVAGAVAAGFLGLRQGAARSRLRRAMNQAADGDFSFTVSDDVGGRFLDAEQALARCIERVESARRRLLEAVATIRAIDFDGSLGRKVDAIIAPLEARYRFADTPQDDVADHPTLGLGGMLWRAGIIAGFYAASFVFAANFAIDRNEGLVAGALVAPLPLLAELAALAIGIALGATSVGRSRGTTALGIAMLGAALAATYWCRTYELFAALRIATGFGAGLALSGLLAGACCILERRAVTTVLLFSGLVVGPLAAGLCAEALGRRAAFLSIGAGLLVLLPFLVFRRPSAEVSPREPGEGRSGAVLMLATLPAAAALLVTIPVGPGYDNYLLGGALAAVLGLLALVTPALPAAGVAAALALAAIPGLAGFDAHQAGQFVAAAALGVALGGASRSAAAGSGGAPMRLAAAACAGLIAVAAAATYALPQAAIPAACAMLVAALAFGRRRSLAERTA